MFVMWKRVKNTLPFLEWGKNYDINKAISDLVAGITVGLTLIPQSIAYASLAGLEPQYGLYSSLCGGLIYLFFGTIPELSIAPTALLSLLTYTYTKNLSFDNVHGAILLCFFAGCVELLCGILHLGFLVDFVSTPVVAAFTSAGAITIASSQIKNLIGLKFEAESFFDIWKNVFAHLPELQRWDTLLGLACCIILLLMRKLKDYGAPLIEKKGEDKECVFKKILWMFSVSRNALVVVGCAATAYLVEQYGGESPFSLTAKVPSGWPNVTPPSFQFHQNNKTITFTEVIVELETGIIFIPFVAILANIGIAKAFARGKVVDATQEMIAVGICNIAGSFFGSYPVNASFSRAAVGSASGIRTPVAGIYTAALVFMAFSLLTPYFSYIPKPTLAAVIICAVIFMIEVMVTTQIWKIYRIDLIPFTITLIACLMISIELGIVIGILVDVIKMLCISSRSKVLITEVPVDTNKQTYVKFTPTTPMLFSSAEYVRKVVMKESLKNVKCHRQVVLDLGRTHIMDFTAGKCLEALVKDLRKNGKLVAFVNVSENIVGVLKEMCGNEAEIFATESELANFLSDQREDNGGSVLVINNFLTVERPPLNTTKL